MSLSTRSRSAAIMLFVSLGALSPAVSEASSAPPVAASGARLLASAAFSAPPVINTFRNRNTDRCLDDSREGLRSIGCNNLDFQKWEVTVVENEHREIKNKHTQRCLDDSGAGLRTYPCNNLTFQKWNVTKYRDGVVLQNHETKRCVDDSREGLRSFHCNNLNFQRWF
ncbi:RICIN domain-containing protein [Streptosporangium soli]|nr:RICIN domain-containing protein [Streptosporangium sp. KLBMP 9127]